MANGTIDLPVFLIPVVKFSRNEVEKCSIEKNKMDRYWNLSEKAVVVHKTKAVGEFRPQKMASVRSASPLTDISDYEKRTRRRTVFLRLRISRISVATIVVVRKEEAGAIAVADIIAPQHLRPVSEIFVSPA